MTILLIFSRTIQGMSIISELCPKFVIPQNVLVWTNKLYGYPRLRLV